MLNAIKTVQDEVAAAVAKVGQEEFEKRVVAVLYVNWPKRQPTDDDGYFRGQCATHRALVELDVAREINL